MTRRAGLAWIATFGVAVAAVVAVLTIGAFAGDDRASGAGADYDREQLCNARTIMDVGSSLGLSERDQTIAVMTAIGESSLRNIAYGDWETSGVRNPDGSPTSSVGLFQQQDEWGTREQRLDPQAAAFLFYAAMTERVPQPERDGLTPTVVAHRTQVNDDPSHYEEYWPAALAVVEELTAAAPAAAAPPCP